LCPGNSGHKCKNAVPKLEHKHEIAVFVSNFFVVKDADTDTNPFFGETLGICAQTHLAKIGP
jgi:hypothetical protein